MATTRTARRDPASRSGELDRAVKAFLKAIPVDHLDRRLTELERWYARVEKEVRRSGLLVARAAADTARIAVMGPPPAARRGSRARRGRTAS